MDNPFEDIKNALDKFQSCVSKDLKEIRKQKAEIQKLKNDILNHLQGGKFIRDDKRIVLSAPEIVIGNVDASGDLSDGGVVIIRGQKVEADGVGENGVILTRANRIVQTAVDPGIDGLEAVVHPNSAITSQARSILLQSDNCKDGFSQAPNTPVTGIQIHSDTTLIVDSTVSAEKRKKDIESRETKLKTQQTKLEMEAQKLKMSIDKDYLTLQGITMPKEALNATDELARLNYNELELIHQQMLSMFPKLYQNMVDYIHTVSSLAETSRQLTALDTEKKDIKTGDDFIKNTTKAILALAAEHIEMMTRDGDGNIKENDEAGIRVTTPRMDVSMLKDDGSLIEKGFMSLQAEKVTVSTANPKVSGETADMPATGSVNVVSKKINLLAIDGEVKDNKFAEKALTKAGRVRIRAEKVDVSATDTEGKATGNIAINAKAVEVKAMDVDKDKRTNKELAKGSTMLLLAEKMFVGAKDKTNKSKSLQTVSEEMGLFADKTLEAQQGDGKAVLQLADGNAAVSGSKTDIYGATTIQAKTEIKDELKAPKATIDNVEAKTSFKSTNISDGMPMPASPSSASLSAKLKAEDAPKES